MAAYDFKSQDFYFHPSFFPDNTRKSLVYNDLCENPMGAYFRKNKYIERGYTIDFEQELKIILHIKDKKYDKLKDLITELRGIGGYPGLNRLYRNFNKAMTDNLSKNILMTSQNVIKLLESDFEETIKDLDAEEIVKK